MPTLFRLCLAPRLSADAGMGLVTAASVGAALWEDDMRDKDHLPEMRRMPRGPLERMNQVAAAIHPHR